MLNGIDGFKEPMGLDVTNDGYEILILSTNYQRNSVKYLDNRFCINERDTTFITSN